MKILIGLGICLAVFVAVCLVLWLILAVGEDILELIGCCFD